MVYQKYESVFLMSKLFFVNFKIVSDRRVQNIFHIFILQQFKVIAITVHVPP